jgi:hypothetical protein
MRATLLRPKMRILNALASFASSSTGTNAMSPKSSPPVTRMERPGVWNRSLIALKLSGAS